MPRNRVIYQSEALFVGDGTLIPTAAHPSGNIKQLHRVQSANYGFSISRQNINQFGNLAKIDSIVMEAPTVSLDFSYYLHDGTNETTLGFTTGANASSAASFISGLLDSSATSVISGRNFHILTVPEGNDANAATLAVSNNINSNTISIGNGFITNYSVEASVGGIPTVNVGVEGLNINVVTGNSGTNPALVVETATQSSTEFALPLAVTGSVGVSALRPGDITLTIEDGFLADFAPGEAGNSEAHVQSFSIEIPIGRSTLQRIGSNFGFAKVIDFPVEVTVNISATVAELKNSGTLASIKTTDTPKTLTFQFKDSGNASKIVYTVKGAKVVSENFSSSIGDNKTVDIVFTTQIGGPQDTNNGVFVGVAP
jgi:hypothetical protein